MHSSETLQYQFSKESNPKSPTVIFDPAAESVIRRRRALFFTPGVYNGTFPVPYGRLDFDNRQPDGNPTFIPRKDVQIEEYLPLRERPLSSS